MLSFLNVVNVESLQLVFDNARLPARSETMSAPPVRRRRDRDAWKRRSCSTGDLDQLHHCSINLDARSRSSPPPPPNHNRWDTSCPQMKSSVSTPSLMLLHKPRRQSSIRGLDNCSPPKKPVRRMNSLEPTKDTARLLEQALLITSDCATCQF